MRVLAVSVALATLAVSCGGASVNAEKASSVGAVYKVRVTSDAPPPCGDPSCVTVDYVAWVASGSSSYRIETRDGSGYATTTIYANGRYLNSSSPPQQRSVRIGSPAFLGHRADVPEQFERLLGQADRGVGSSVTLERKGFSYTLTIEEEISAAEAGRRRLFAVSPEEPGTTVSRERTPGEPTALPVDAYWFGPTLGDREAFTAIDHGGEEIVHVTFYGDPEEIAAGKTHAYPDRGLPRREVQVGSQPLDHPRAQKTVRALNGRNGDLVSSPLARTKVRLQNGEEATLFPTVGEGDSFAVATATTLVMVSGVWGADAIRLAPLLRPL